MAIRPLSFREVERKLMAAGFVEAARRGSHVKFRTTEPAGARTVSVPDHREIARGTLRSILRQAGLSPDEFEAL